MSNPCRLHEFWSSPSSDDRQQIRALRERISTLSASVLRISASLDVDTVLREVVESARTLTGVLVDLTATEYELLRVLSLDAGRVVTFETLLRRVWAKRENADANLVRIFVRNLRRKLGDSAASPAYLFNERGVGYRMAKAPGRSNQR